MKSRMNKLMSLCLVAMMGTTFIPQPIQAEEVSEFEEESFEEATVEFEEATFEEEKQNVEASKENAVIADFEHEGLKYQITDENKKEVKVLGVAQGQSKIERLDIPSTVVHKSQTYDVTSIGESAFEGCKRLAEVCFDRLDNRIETIGNSAFAGCTSLYSVKLPKGLKTIGDSAFKGCIGIRKIFLHEGLKTIGDSAFELGESTTADDSPHLEFINIPSSVETLGKIFGDKSPLGANRDVLDPFREQEPALAFPRETLPKGIENLLDMISKGNNKPTIYFPNTETAMNTYAGKNSPFVKTGLVNPKLFDSSIEHKSIQMCPKTVGEVPIYDFVQYIYDIYEEARRFTSTNPDVATAKSYSFDQKGKITAKSIGETTISFVNVFNGKELVSDHNKFKVTVDHDYVWQIEKFPTADQSGSMFQYCLNCRDKKESVPIPPTDGGSGGGSTGGGSTGGSTSGGSGGGSSTGGGSTIDPNAPTPQVENAVYRAYNSSNGEHLYTTNYQEFKAITKNGWDDEGIAFMSELKEKGHAVYRVYNPNSGLHHYTTDVNEKNTLVSLGWNDEGVAFYTSKNPKDTPVYRVYNENDGNHHYTMNANEALALISMGWQNEGIAFFTTPMK